MTSVLISFKVRFFHFCSSLSALSHSHLHLHILTLSLTLTLSYSHYTYSLSLSLSHTLSLCRIVTIEWISVTCKSSIYLQSVSKFVLHNLVLNLYLSWIRLMSAKPHRNVLSNSTCSVTLHDKWLDLW